LKREKFPVKLKKITVFEEAVKGETKDEDCDTGSKFAGTGCGLKSF